MLQWPPRPTGVAQSKDPSSRFRLAPGLTPPSSGFRLTRGLTPPSSGFHLARGLTPPLSGFRLARGLISASLVAPSQAYLLPHVDTGIQCSDTAEPRHHTPGNHAPALFRQLPRACASPPLQGAVEYGWCQSCGTVLPTLVRLTRRALEGGPAAHSNPSLVNL
jgi:hypothetical protein